MDSLPGGQTTFSDEEKAAIQAQLERLLENPYFSHSRRFPSFLRFVVERTLGGQTELLKERTLGMEIFGRNADYDTSSDPIVRVTAAEIRKRIAQYYQEPGHEHEIRLSLPSGSYVPHFEWPAGLNGEAAAPAATILGSAEAAGGSAKKASRRPWVAGSVAALLAVVTLALAPQLMHRPAFSFFWGPVLKNGDPVLFCIADQNQYSAI